MRRLLFSLATLSCFAAVQAGTNLRAPWMPRFDPMLTPAVGSSYGATYYYEFWNGGRNPLADPATFPHIASMGAKWTRIDFNRYQANVSHPNIFQLDARPFMNAALNAGLNVVVVLTDANPPIGTQALSDWKQFITKAVTEFQVESEAGRIVWEVWNEPTNPAFWNGQQTTSGWQRANDYMEILKATRDALRAVSPNALISGPSNGWGGETERAFYLRCRDLGLEGIVDFVSVHPSKRGSNTANPGYPMQEPEAIWGRDSAFATSFAGYWHETPYGLSDLKRYFVNRPLIVTEWPYGANPSPAIYSTLGPTETQTANSWRAVLVSLSEDIPIHLQWEFQEEVAQPHEAGWFANMGIRDLSGTPRPVYYELGDFLRDYAGWTAVKMPSSVRDGKIIIDRLEGGCYRLVIEGPSGQRRVLRWGAAKQNANVSYPEMPVFLPAIRSVAAQNPITYGGTNNITVRANGRDTLPAAVFISENSNFVTAPTTVTMPAMSEQVSFSVNCNPAATQQVVTVTAKLNETTASGNFTIRPIPNFTLTLPEEIDGGYGFETEVSIPSAAPINTEVKFVDFAAALNSPSPAIIPAGSLFRRAWTTTNEVASPISVTMTASILNVSRAKSIVIRPKPNLTALAFPTTTVTGGSLVNGTVRLSRINAGGSQTVTLSDSSALVTTPSSTVVANGQSAKTFVVGASASASTYTATITATLRSVTKTVTLTITP